jgi:hypothetical protein
MIALTVSAPPDTLSQKQAAIQQALQDGDHTKAVALARQLSPIERATIIRRMKQAQRPKQASTIVVPVPFQATTERSRNYSERDRLQAMIAQRDKDRAQAEIERKKAEVLAEIARRKAEAEERRHRELVEAQRDVANAVRQNSFIRRGF